MPAKKKPKPNADGSRRVSSCGFCGMSGHTKRSCPKKKEEEETEERLTRISMAKEEMARLCQVRESSSEEDSSDCDDFQVSKDDKKRSQTGCGICLHAKCRASFGFPQQRRPLCNTCLSCASAIRMYASCTCRL